MTLEGRFAIGLPERNHGVQKLSIPTPFGVARGEAFVWTMQEGSFVVGRAEAVQPVDTPELSKQLFDQLRSSLKRLASENTGAVGPERLFELDKHPGFEQRVDLFTGSMVQRTYLVSKTIYQTLAVVKTEQRDYFAVAVRALDTFRILSDADIAAKVAEKIAKAEPSPLPQQPASDRNGNDASDRNLLGRVKSILEETQDLTGNAHVQTKKRHSYDLYNEQGNLIRSELYDYKGNLSTIRVYGYIDGKRVSRSSSIEYENNPPPALVPTDSSKPAKKSDPRYDTRYEFEYDGKKRLVQEKWFRSNGELFNRVVYKYDGLRVETLTYSASGDVTQDHLTLVDERRNKIEHTARDPREGALGSKYIYTYEYDPKGNWTRRTTSKMVSKDGVSKPEPLFIEVRTITYF